MKRKPGEVKMGKQRLLSGENMQDQSAEGVVYEQYGGLGTGDLDRELLPEDGRSSTESAGRLSPNERERLRILRETETDQIKGA